MMLKKFVPVLLALAAVVLTVSMTVSAKSINADPPVNPNPAPVLGPNLLTNPGLEGHYNQQCSQMGQAPWIAVPCDPKNYNPSQLNLWATAQVPFGWSAWWRAPSDDFNDPNYFNNYPSSCDSSKGSTPDTCVPWHNPEFRDTAGGPQETGPTRRIEGDNSQKYFTFYTVHEAGLYQVIGGVKPGQRLRFSVYMEAWSSAHNDSFHSDGQATMGMKVGIDPFGGNNPWSPNIIWSPVQESFDQFSQFAIEAVAKNSIVSVWTRSQPFYAQQHNDVYVDAASLNVVGTAAPVVNRTPTKLTTTKIVTTTKVITLSSGLTRTLVTTSTITVPATTKIVTTTKIITSSTGVTRTVVTTSTIAVPKVVIATTGTTPSTPYIGPNEYVVKQGDSLRAIAKALGLHWSDIAALNPVIQPPDYVIYPGQVLKLK